MADIAIRANGLSKRYELRTARNRHDTLRDHVADHFKGLFRRKTKLADSSFWALKNVSFEVKEGDVIGIIGRNGAGKSTLLKILSRITKPTEGEAEIHGRVGSLLEVGTGFHPELTGRENIYLNGAILGMEKEEIERKFDHIVAFADIERFIETPVKRYSSGMYVRLAFAVAAHLEPEVLIVDEVLAVGDIGFQKKCLGRMGEVAGQGRTVLFVSHNMAAVQHLCNKLIVLESGQIVFAGNPGEGIDFYLNSLDGDSEHSSHIVDLTNAVGRPREYKQTLTRLLLYTGDGVPFKGSLSIGAPLSVHVSFQLNRPTPDFNVTLVFENNLGQRVLDISSHYHRFDFQPKDLLPGEHTFICNIPSLILLNGEYRVTVFVDVDGVNVDRVENAVRFSVIRSDYYGGGKLPSGGYMVLDHSWHHKNPQDHHGSPILEQPITQG